MRDGKGSPGTVLKLLFPPPPPPRMHLQYFLNRLQFFELEEKGGGNIMEGGFLPFAVEVGYLISYIKVPRIKVQNEMEVLNSWVLREHYYYVDASSP